MVFTIKVKQTKENKQPRFKGLFKKPEVIDEEEIKVQEFLDMISPSTIKFFTDHYICGNTYRSCWALREYPTSTEDQALLRYLGEKDGITLKVYARTVTPAEEKKIIGNAANKNRMRQSNTNDLQESIEAQSNLQDVVELIANMHRSREPLVHCAVYIELIANDYDSLKLLQTEVQTELVRSKLSVDKLILRQQKGFLASMPAGYEPFKGQYERVLPATSVANLFPFNYSGKTDNNGFFLGSDKFGSNIIVDFDKREDDKTNSSIIILGNSGQGKSYLLKLIQVNLRLAGKRLINLDPEHEYMDLTRNLNGVFVDLMSGKHVINVLQPKVWSIDEDEVDEEDSEIIPDTFKQSTVLAQHVSFLKDFFRSYKDFTDVQLDTLELLLMDLYHNFGIDDTTDIASMHSDDFPILQDLYELAEKEFKYFDKKKRQLYTEKSLREICLLLNSICVGSESKFFNGYTNIRDNEYVTFGVKGLLQASKNVRNAMLFNILSYMSNELLTKGNTVASIDEFYLFLTNPVAVEYIRNFMKRVRKKESAIILASQNLEDFNIEGIKELTKPLFAIPTHTFLFNAGNTDSKFYIDSLQLEESEFELIRYPQRGVCLYKCGNERYNLAVHAPKHKEVLFGSAGGR